MDSTPFQAVIEAFNSDDHDRRTELLSRCLAPDAEVVHVHGEAVGPVEFSQQIGAMRAGLAGLTGRLSAEPQTVQRWDHQPWELVDDHGATFASGRYVARRADDGTFDVLLSLPDAHA